MKKLSVVFLMCSFLAAHAADQNSTPAPAQGETQKITSFLNQTIVWHRAQAAMQQMATEPADVLYFNENREIADDVVRNTFDFARKRAQVLTSQTPKPAEDANQPSSRYSNLAERTNRLDKQLKQKQAEAEDLRRRLASAGGNTRTQLSASLSEVQSEVELLKTRRDSMKSMLQFLSDTNANALGSGTLQSQIEELAKTVPQALATDEKSGSAGSSSRTQAAATEHRAEPTGIIALVTDLIRLSRKMDTIQEAIDSTDSLIEATRTIRRPLIADMRSLMAKADDISNAPDSTDPAALAQQRKQLDALTTQFKQQSNSVLPLGKQGILLDVYKRTLNNWRATVQQQYRAELKSLIVRLVILGIIIGIIAVVSSIWRRATFRYVQDTRRRYQFLVLRRIVVWIVIAIVVAFSFAAELGTLATFAGLLTAGIAVALQNVILSVAGYFFLIGRYGVRVGDRVQIGGVTGDVIEIGLVRIHIMEAISGSSDVRPTGRIVVFSNAVVFQPNAGLFKQIPGTNFVWHEITLTLAPDSSYHQVEERLMGAVQKVYAEYKADIEAQRRRMEQSLMGVPVRSMQPESQLRLKQTGLEVVIRFPVVLNDAATIDDRMTRALLDAIRHEPKLKLVGSGTPNIQPVRESAAGI